MSTKYLLDEPNFFQDGIKSTGYSYGCRVEAISKVANLVKVNCSTVHNWIHDYEALSYIQESRRGHHSKESSPILYDTDFRDQFFAHMREASK